MRRGRGQRWGGVKLGAGPSPGAGPKARGGARPLTLGAVAGSKQGLLVLTVICKKDEKACEDINSSSDIRGGRVGGGLGPLTVP